MNIVERMLWMLFGAVAMWGSYYLAEQMAGDNGPAVIYLAAALWGILVVVAMLCRKLLNHNPK